MMISYWGCAELSNGYKTYEHLKRFCSANKSIGDHEQFAAKLSNELCTKFSSPLLTAKSRGLGVHFAFWEKHDDFDVPELILVSNWKSPAYNDSSLKFNWSRRSHKIIASSEPQFKTFRREFYNDLKKGVCSRYNNGDPLLFVPLAKGIGDTIVELNKRKDLSKNEPTDLYRTMVREPIRLIRDLQKNLCLPEKRFIGGALHDAAILPSGEVKASPKIQIVH